MRWGNTTSQNLKVSNGVWQGGLLSPIMFALYMDDMLENLKRSNLGCHIGNVFFGGLGYADDSILLTLSISALNL